MEKFNLLKVISSFIFLLVNFQLCLSEPCPYNKETTLELYRLGAR